MFHVQHLFEICVVLVGGAGNGLIYWLVGRRVDARIDNGFASFAKKTEDALKQHADTVLQEFSSHIRTAKDQLAGMDRRVCFKCKRQFTQYEVTPNGALCAGCGGKV